MIFKREFSLKRGDENEIYRRKNQKKKFIQCGYYCSNSVNDGRVWKKSEPQRTNHIDYLACIWRTDRFSVNDLIDEFNGTEGKKEGIKSR